MIQAFGLTSIPRKAHPPAVDDASFEARAGRVTALLGAPGAGKTTTLRLMLELQQGRGITYFRGRPLRRIPHPSREVGVVLGDVPGHPARSVRSHLRMLCAATGVRVRRADEVLEAVGLISLREERLGTLSHGVDRRLGLACALLPDPHTLVLDEPADGLSAREGRWFHEALRAYAEQGGTVLFTTADPKEAARTADRVVTMDHGTIVADQEAREFARNRLRPRVAVRSPHAARLAAVLTKEARTGRRSVEVVSEEGNRLSVYGSTTADVGETAYRHGILVHQLADEVGDMGPGAGMLPAARQKAAARAASLGDPGGTAQEPAPHSRQPAVVGAEAERRADEPTLPGQSIEKSRPGVDPFEEPRPGAESTETFCPRLDAAQGEAHPRGDDADAEAPTPVSGPRATSGPRPASAPSSPTEPTPTPSQTSAPPQASRAPQTSEPESTSATPIEPPHPGIAPEAEATTEAASATASRTSAAAPAARTDAGASAPAARTGPGSSVTRTAPAARVDAEAQADAAADTNAAAGMPGEAAVRAGQARVEAPSERAEPLAHRTAGIHSLRKVFGRTGAAPSPSGAPLTPDPSAPLPPPISVRSAPSPLRPLRYELRRAAGIGTGFFTCGAVLVVSVVTALLLARIGHTSQARLFAAWPQQVPLPPAALGAGLLGALSFGDEFRHPALAADRGTVPRRLGLLSAKLLVSGATAVMLAFLTMGCDAEMLYVVYGREVAQVPVDWLSLSASWFALVVGCAWAGVLAAGVFRSTAAGLAAVLAVPVVVVPLVQKAMQGTSVRTAAGFPERMREVLLLQWPFGGERYLVAAARVVVQPVGSAMALSLTALLCAYLLTTLRSRVR